MAGATGISGEEIRREQEASRLRSQLGQPRTVATPSPVLTAFVGGIEIDFLAPLWACLLLGRGTLGLVFVVLVVGLRLATSKVVTIRSENGLVSATVSRPLRRAGAQARMIIDDAVLCYSNSWSCRRAVLRGSNVTVDLAKKSGEWIRPLLGVRSLSVASPPFRVTARSIALNLPNIMAMAACMAAAWEAGRYSLAVVLMAVFSLISSLSSCLVDAPRLLVSPVKG